ncbi:MAG TPA: hypothetical protein PKD87_07960, partial [Burkholderiaceae bacterium]|nr:hypothetical protein [Burkholderiaceae bacterium]
GSGDTGSTGGTGGSGSADDPPPLSGVGTIGDQRTLLIRGLPPVLGLLDWSLFASAGKSFKLDESGRLEAVGVNANGSCGLWSYCLSLGTARVAEAGADPFVSWGRWTDGTLQAQGIWANLADRTLSPNDGVHYLVGVPSTTVPTQGVFTYQLIGATAPTLSTGAVSPGVFSGTAGVAFGPGQPARVGLDGSVAIGGASYGFTTPGGASDPARSTLSTTAGYAFSGSLPASHSGNGLLSCGSAGCTVGVQGGLFGPNAARLGLSYQVQGSAGGSTISGVSVFAQQPAQP